ncbi:hypothetical protein RF55_19534 [Lasius niger]|uniref:Uncharacterized protein n=1 Tax=Lasius niger TaxID=67767 RepID=A0A0J7K0F1_LASNI|nr:hypothetical protein RF55_19534 [Lasius niger]
MTFPNKINYSLPSGYPGDIASANPRRSAISSEAGFRCGLGGLVVGEFGWVQDDGVNVLNSASASNKNAVPTGFVIRDMTAILQGFNEEGSMVIPSGFPANLMTGGDYWAISSVDTKAGDAVFANPTDGTLAASGNITGFSVARGGPAGNIIMISAPCAPMPAQANTPKS